MRILLVTNYFEPDSGAAAVRLTRLAYLLQERGHQLTILTSLPHYPQGRIHQGYRRRWTVVENRKGLRVIQTSLWATPSHRISRKFLSQLSFMLTAILRGLFIPRPDVLLIEGQPVFTAIAGVFLARLKRRPYVLNVSDLWPDHLLSVGAVTEQSRVYRLARWLVDSMYRGAAGIVAMSPAWARAIEGHIGPTDKLSVIYNGVDLTRFHPDVDTTAFRAQHGLNADKIVAFIGTFATQYDFEMMLEVTRYLKDEATVLLVGQGSQADYVRQRIDAGGLEHLRWLEWVEHAEMPAVWNTATLTFWAMRDHPLYQGTIPAKLYEALACGTPIIASMSGEGATMIEASGAGVVVPVGDAQALIAAIRKILNDDALQQQLRYAGRAYAEAHFDPVKVAEAYELILSKVHKT
ncbi:MAG: glycosyltransferase family 4 protein [Anaerolineales bacterium]|nr:glycosyltransferase family 4 protein [Anaerolineales bacterium]